MQIEQTCFVIMPIGAQKFDDVEVSAASLKEKYSELIKGAIQIARPNIEVIRADDFEHSGSITSDIVNHIMKCDFVVADVTYPNPNVFYELGLRHACKPGTIILKEESGPNIPFDIAHLRYISYNNTPKGLKELSEKMKAFFDNHEKDKDRPDNEFLYYAKLIEFEFPSYKKQQAHDPALDMINILFSNPSLLKLCVENKGKVNDKDMTSAMMQNPESFKKLFEAFVKSGEISLVGKNKQSNP